MTDLGLTARVNTINSSGDDRSPRRRSRRFWARPRITASDILLHPRCATWKRRFRRRRATDTCRRRPAPAPGPRPAPGPGLHRPRAHSCAESGRRRNLAAQSGRAVARMLVSPVRPGLTRLAAARAALSEATRAPPPNPLLTEADVVDVASDYGDPRLGDGLNRLTAVMAPDPLARDSLLWLGDSGQALALDRTAQAVTCPLTSPTLPVS